MSRIMRGGKIYSATSISLPYHLKLMAREYEINMTQVLIRGIESELDKKGLFQGTHVTKQRAPEHQPNPDQEMVNY